MWPGCGASTETLPKVKLSEQLPEQLTYLFEPRSIAVIGASNVKIKWGYIIPVNILAGGWKGELYPVNPGETEILKRPCFKSVKEIEGDVDLAIVTVPAACVARVVGECVQKGVKTCLVISSGFSEAGAEGMRLAEEVAGVVEGNGMRLVGPNTMGIYSGPARLNAMMSPVRPAAGKIAFAAQSGNLGTQMLSIGKTLGVGFSRFVCIGNETDLKVADYLQYFARDPATEVILLYIEGLKAARRFIEVAMETSPKKPIVVLKAGKTKAGVRAAASHSAALAADETIFRGVMKQTGMIEADTTEEMLDIAKAFAAVPLPRGNRVGVITWGGGWGVVMADALARHSLELVELPQEIIRELDSFLPPYWSKGNPVDMVGTLDLSIHFRCLEIVSRCGCVDSVISLGTIGMISSIQSFVLGDSTLDDVERGRTATKVARSEFLKEIEKTDEAYRGEMLRLMQETRKPIIAVSFPATGAVTPVLASQSEVVIYPSPERAAKALAALCEYKKFLEQKCNTGA
ncbi:MAG: hypothetical protein CVT63_06455 [Candidatus Anoxymicrobium japonicum]|uniref:CoA-binding domain-containing protein n=1 Tax=Candidatus Anoxymicrobium japonicum TaxID=2013648 RepID=A0A2N3G563_9ACTN|nr:MAG: hypothetical protein CVT63_06455 [Candidatus Anoxymicrobium japonicum]